MDEVAVFDSATAERVDLQAVLHAVDGADVVLLGELHGHPIGLEWNAEIYRRTLAENPEAVLCLEFLTRDTQFLLDAYLQGLLDWNDLKKACDATPGSDPEPHRPMIDTAREHEAPVVAANSPRLYTGAARKEGMERLRALTEEQRRLFDAPQANPSEAYRERFFDLMRPKDVEEGEDLSPAQLERVEGLFRAQCLWDGTMAASVVRALEAGGHPALLAVGSFHVNRKGGTVQAIETLRPSAKVLVLTFVSETSDHLKEAHRDLADYVAYVGRKASE